MSDVSEIDGAEISRVQKMLGLSRSEMARRLGVSLDNYKRLIAKPGVRRRKEPSKKVVGIVEAMRESAGR